MKVFDGCSEFMLDEWPDNLIAYCFVHPIFSYFGFWYFGHFSCVIFFPVFFRLAHLALQNVNKDYVIFSNSRNFVAKSDQKPKTKNGMNETLIETEKFLL